MTFAVVVFPGSNCDHDAYHAAKHVLGQQARFVWHKDTSLGDADVVILPGGFSHGDYLRTGAIARFSPVMSAVKEFAAAGRPVLGICRFSDSARCGCSPPAALRQLWFHCDTFVSVSGPDTPFTGLWCAGPEGSLPIAHGEGNYYAPPDTLPSLKARPSGPAAAPRMVMSPRRSPERILNGIAGICRAPECRLMPRQPGYGR
jgi:phosphoribosylformylglycinamidine synthase